MLAGGHEEGGLLVADDPGRSSSSPDASRDARTVSLDSLRLLGEAVNALRVAADALGGADARFAGAARGVGGDLGDSRIGAAYDSAFHNTRQTLHSLRDCWERLARGLDTVADAYMEGGPSAPAAGAP